MSILQDLEHAMQMFDKMRPLKVEIWISKWAPPKNKDGSTCLWKLPVKQPFLIGFYPETEFIFIVNQDLFEFHREFILSCGLPVFKSGGILVT